MSGHSKWHKVRQYKGGIDAKRSSVYTKMARLISVAARSGGDPDMNFALRMNIDRAKAVSVPKDVIERAIRRGTGEEGEGLQIEEAVYEGIGPGKVGIIVRALALSDRIVVRADHNGLFRISRFDSQNVGRVDHGLDFIFADPANP